MVEIRRIALWKQIYSENNEIDLWALFITYTLILFIPWRRPIDICIMEAKPAWVLTFFDCFTVILQKKTDVELYAFTKVLLICVYYCDCAMTSGQGVLGSHQTPWSLSCKSEFSRGLWYNHVLQFEYHI